MKSHTPLQTHTHTLARVWQWSFSLIGCWVSEPRWDGGTVTWGRRPWLEAYRNYKSRAEASQRAADRQSSNRRTRNSLWGRSGPTCVRSNFHKLPFEPGRAGHICWVSLCWWSFWRISGGSFTFTGFILGPVLPPPIWSTRRPRNRSSRRGPTRSPSLPWCPAGSPVRTKTPRRTPSNPSVSTGLEKCPRKILEKHKSSFRNPNIQTYSRCWKDVTFTVLGFKNWAWFVFQSRLEETFYGSV